MPPRWGLKGFRGMACYKHVVPLELGAGFHLTVTKSSVRTVQGTLPSLSFFRVVSVFRGELCFRSGFVFCLPLV
jgi:hypothetical protein